MDTFNEKKWFVYVADHHEGPYSLADLQAKLANGSVNAASYLWTEGMSDWRVFSEIPETAPLLTARPASPTPPKMPPAPPVGESSFSTALHASMLEERTGSMGPESAESPVSPKLEVKESPSITLTAASSPAAAASLVEEEEMVAEPPRKKRSRVLGVAILLMIPLLLAILYLQGLLDPILKQPALQDSIESAYQALEPMRLSLVEKFPALSKYVSPIPSIKDVSDEEFAELRAAAAQPAKEGPKAAVALSNGDMLAPGFHVASNLPDGAIFEVLAVGVPDTLLNTTSMTASSRVVLKKKLGKSAPLRAPGGSALPRGSYEVFVYESAAQQPAEVTRALSALPDSALSRKLPVEAPKVRKLVLRKEYFLGGPKDATYASRLKEYHDKLREKAAVEIGDVKNLAAELDARLAETLEAERKIRSQKNKKLALKAWGEFHAAWNAKNDPILGKLSKAPEELMNEMFFGPLYLAAQSASQAVTKVHALHNAFFTGSVDAKTFDIQTGESTNMARSSLELLKVKIDQAEKIPPSPNGMPRKEGL